MSTSKLRLALIAVGLAALLPCHAAWASRPTWSPTVPPTRFGHSLALDSRRHVLLVFGGFTNTQTWDYVWAIPVDSARVPRRLLPEGVPPPPKTGYSAVYDSIADRLVILGDPSATVWSLSLGDEPRWSTLDIIGTRPSPRSGSAVTLDPLRHRIIVFGGYASGSDAETFLDDVWALDLSGVPVWHELSPQTAGPVGRQNACIAYDSHDDRILLVGGSAATGKLIDVWALSLGDTPSWSQVSPSGGTPLARSSFVTTFDPIADRLLVHGGESPSGLFADDLWSLQFSSASDATWMLLSPAGPAPRGHADHCSVYDPSSHSMLIYGGATVDGSSVGGVNSLVSLALTGDPVWTDLAPGSESPPSSTSDGAFLDSHRDRLVAIEGPSATNAGRPMAVWWTLLAGLPSWTRVEPESGPDSRFEGAACLDSIHDRVLIFGGFERSGGLCGTDTWSLSLSTFTWSQLTVDGAPPAPRGATAAVFDGKRNRMLIFGGEGPDGALGDLWALNLSNTPTWEALAPHGPLPPARAGHAAAIDADCRDVYVLGGVSGTHGLLDCWRLDLDSLSWRQLQPDGDPPGWCSGHSMLWDATRNALFVLGSQCSDTRGEVGVWSLDSAATAWTRLRPLVPSNRQLVYGSAVRDPVRDHIIALGGTLDNDPDPWILSFDGSDALRLEAQPTSFTGLRAAHLSWLSVDSSVPSAILYRSIDAGAFEWIGQLFLDNRFQFVHDETDLIPARRYEFRLTPLVAGHSEFIGDVSFVGPAFPTPTLQSYPNPTSGRISVQFWLPPTVDPRTTIELFDLQGRRLSSQVIGSAGPGDHTIQVGKDIRLRPGVYLVRLASPPGPVRTSRVVVLSGASH